VHPAFIPRNKLSPTVIFLVVPTLGHPGAVAVKLGFKDVGRRYLNIVSKLAIFTSPMCIGGARSPSAAISAGTICAACGLVAIAAGRMTTEGDARSSAQSQDAARRGTTEFVGALVVSGEGHDPGRPGRTQIRR
jgi:hypothetical protein